MAKDPEPSTAELEAAKVADVDAAANAPQTAPERPAGELKAEARELARQAAIVEAVAKAGETELPKLGGVLLDPGLGR